MTTETVWQHDIDARGLRCPEPVMMLHAGVRRMTAGEVARLRTTDSASTRDVLKFCQHLGHELLAQQESEGEFVFLVRKAVAGSR